MRARRRNAAHLQKLAAKTRRPRTRANQSKPEHNPSGRPRPVNSRANTAHPHRCVDVVAIDDSHREIFVHPLDVNATWRSHIGHGGRDASRRGTPRRAALIALPAAHGLLARVTATIRTRQLMSRNRRRSAPTMCALPKRWPPMAVLGAEANDASHRARANDARTRAPRAKDAKRKPTMLTALVCRARSAPNEPTLPRAALNDCTDVRVAGPRCPSHATEAPRYQHRGSTQHANPFLLRR